MPRPIRLTAHFGIVHGQAVGMMLPAVVRFNGQDAGRAARLRGTGVGAGNRLRQRRPRAGLGGA